MPWNEIRAALAAMNDPFPPAAATAAGWRRGDLAPLRL